jgi:hypothetical protein
VGVPLCECCERTWQWLKLSERFFNIEEHQYLSKSTEMIRNQSINLLIMGD